ncbi:ROK family protein [Erwinia sp. V71]|uniref:ROK family protein n=1 Tax=Erwinia sp. V71 TaxID=3369424 RepID=UPI003F633308
MSHVVICLDIGASFLKAGLSAQPGKITPLATLPMPVDSWSAFTDAVQQLLQQIHGQIDARSPLAISTAGLVDPVSGEVYASNIPAFHHRRVAQQLQDLLQRPVFIANDADCFALAEATTGRGAGERIVFGAILGSGVGGGLVIDGRIVSGSGGVSGEWGHGPITRREVSVDGVMYTLPRLACACGQRGCLDTAGGARGIERLHQLLHQQVCDSKAIVTGWRQREHDAVLTVKVWCELVSEPLAFLVNLTGAGRIVVGGGLAAEPALIALLDQRVRQLILRRLTTPLVVAGALAEQGGLLGASVLGHAAATGNL